MKTRATLKNSAASLFYYGITVIAGILLRKAVIAFLGIRYQGIDGLFTGVISMLSIAELGISTAIISNLYAPLAQGDTVQVRALLQFYRKYYGLIAAVMLVLGLLAIPVLPLLIKDYDLPYPIASVYIWFLLDAVVSYLLSWRRSIFIADQRNYVISLADAAYMLFTKLFQVLLLWQTGNYIAMLVLGVVFRILENGILYCLSNRQYGYLVPRQREKLNADTLEDIKKKVRGAVFHKVGSFVVNGTDSILISMYLGLTVSGIYSNYFIIVRAVQNICSKTVAAATASVGHLLTEKNEKRSMQVFQQLQLVNLFLTAVAMTGVYCVGSEAVSLLFGREYTVDQFTLFFITLNLGCQCMREVFKAFKEAAGILYEDRFVPIVEAVVNIVASILLLKQFGLAGVFMGTVLCELILYLYTYPVLIYGNLLRGSYGTYLKEQLWQAGVLLVSVLAGGWVCSRIQISQDWLRIGLYCMISVLIAGLCVLVLYGVWRAETGEVVKKIKDFF